MEMILGALLAVFVLVGRWNPTRLTSNDSESVQLLLQPRSWAAMAVVVVAALLVWHRRQQAPQRPQLGSGRSGAVRELTWATVALLGYLVLSSAWSVAPRLALEKALELSLMIVVVVAVGLVWRLPSADDLRSGFLRTMLLVTGILAVAGITSIGGERGEVMGGGPNVFGRNMAFLTVIALGRYVDDNVRRTLFWVAAATVGMLLVVWSGSRGALLSAAAGGGAVLALTRFRLFGRLVVFVLLAGLVGIVFQQSEISQLVADVFRSRILDQTLDQGYTSSRDELFQSAWNAGLAFPLSGLGLNGFFEIHNPNYPHNLFLEVFAEAGVPGAILLCGFLAAMARMLRSVAWGLDNASLGLWTVAFVASQTSGDLFDSRGVFLIPFIVSIPRKNWGAGTPARLGRYATGLLQKPSLFRAAR